MGQRICAIDDCERPVVGRGWCSLHWQRWKRHGNPLTLKPIDGGPKRVVNPWDHIDKSAGPDACWPWTNGTDRDGYGVVKISNRQWRVPRWVLTQKTGRDLTQYEVTRHTCDNPICCNPAHLTPGSAADNSADMVARDRALTGDRHWTRKRPGSFSGVKNPAARLTESDVRTIRTAYANGATQVALAATFHVSQPLISQIVRRAAWAHID